MTRDDILALSVGRDLDREVAARLFQQVHINDCPLGDESCPGVYHPLVGDLGNPCLPRYSTDIKAAWMVVRWVEWHDRCSWTLHQVPGDKYRFDISSDEEGNFPLLRASAEAPTEAEAICKAALLAAGVHLPR